MNVIIVPSSFRLQFRSCAGPTPLVGAAVMRDLSHQGCRGETLTALRPGMVLALRIHVPALESPLMIEKARVQWVRGEMFGLAFLHVQGPDQQRLDEILAGLMEAQSDMPDCVA